MEFKIARKIINGARRRLIDMWLTFRRREKGSLGFSDGQKCLFEILGYPLGRF